ncbi:MAG: dTMP kinase [Gammaproteobacteria bacterium]
MARGRFITLEGGEGLGKSTNLKFVESWLVNHGKDVLVTREPGGTRVGEAIRSLLLDAADRQALTDEAELLLIFAARAEHVQKVIRPALDLGRWVLCDRFTDATYAYQGSGRGLDEARIEYLEHWIQTGLAPDLTILFDAPVEVGLARARRRGDPDRFEREDRDFFERIRSGYLQRAMCFQQRIRVIDASCSLEAVQLAIQKELQELL